jgi:hypothetical protein
LEPVRQITCLGLSPSNGAFPVIQKRVQVIDQRLEFRRVMAFKPMISAFTHTRQSSAQLIKRREPGPDLE